MGQVALTNRFREAARAFTRAMRSGHPISRVVGFSLGGSVAEELARRVDNVRGYSVGGFFRPEDPGTPDIRRIAHLGDPIALTGDPHYEGFLSIQPHDYHGLPDLQGSMETRMQAHEAYTGGWSYPANQSALYHHLGLASSSTDPAPVADTEDWLMNLWGVGNKRPSTAVVPAAKRKRTAFGPGLMPLPAPRTAAPLPAPPLLALQDKRRPKLRVKRGGFAHRNRLHTWLTEAIDASGLG